MYHPHKHLYNCENIPQSSDTSVFLMALTVAKYDKKIIRLYTVLRSANNIALD